MNSFTSKTGLTASPLRKIKKAEQVKTIHLRAIARPAPFVLKPFAGLYNPYSHACSLLCNHPTDNESKDFLKKAKDNLGLNDSRNLLLPDEITAIKTGLELFQNENREHQTHLIQIPIIESVPEELFRRYTETDSRPLTPAPTLASGATRASGSRRCVTPDPFTEKAREKTRLVLDLRRSHSQETLSWQGSSLLEPPLIRIQHIPNAAESARFEDSSPKAKTQNSLLIKSLNRSPSPTPRKKSSNNNNLNEDETDEEDQEVDDEEFIRRRGKKRRKKRGLSGETPIQTAADPETQVATIGGDSHNPSARPSLIPDDGPDVLEIKNKINARSVQKFDSNSYLEYDILRHLRRELNEEIVDNEFNMKRRLALEEALKTLSKEKCPSEVVVQVQNELKIPATNVDLLLSFPRVFSRNAAIFELPLDSRTLESLTPISYLKENVSISSSRKFLYNCVFNKFKIECETEETPRVMDVKNIQNALDAMMGKAMSEKQRKYFDDLIGWSSVGKVMDFRTFSGLCALCERLFAPEYCPQLLDRKADPPHEIETADFEALDRKLYGQHVDEKLVEMLQGIKTR